MSLQRLGKVPAEPENEAVEPKKNRKGAFRVGNEKLTETRNVFAERGKSRSSGSRRKLTLSLGAKTGKVRNDPEKVATEIGIVIGRGRKKVPSGR